LQVTVTVKKFGRRYEVPADSAAAAAADSTRAARKRADKGKKFWARVRKAASAPPAPPASPDYSGLLALDDKYQRRAAGAGRSGSGGAGAAAAAKAGSQ
jgi:hypothetical protein